MHRKVVLLVALAADVLVAPCTFGLGDSPPGFEASRAFLAGKSANGVAVGDFDGDGRLDAATIDWEARGLSVLLGDDLGSFSAPVFSPTEISLGGIAAGDFDGDGLADIAVTRPTRPGFVDLLLSDGAGGFLRSSSTDGGAFPRQVLTADVDGDGALDLVVSNRTPNFQVLRGNGAGGFLSSFPFGVGRTPVALAVADFDGDGLDDVATATVGDQGIVLRRAIGGGLFAPPAAVFPIGTAVGVAAADFDGDGDVDLAMALDGATQAASLVVLENDGTGHFDVAWGTGGVTRVTLLLSGDLDGDGFADLVLHRNDRLSVLVFRGDGDLAFSARAIPWPMGRPTASTLADLDGDGASDLVMTYDINSPAWSHLSVARSEGGGRFAAPLLTPASAHAADLVVRDFDRDGIVDFASVGPAALTPVTVVFGDGSGGARATKEFIVPTNLSPISLAAGDLDSNGSQDLLVIGDGPALILAGDGAGGFAPRADRPNWSRFSPALGDFDGNGHADVVFCNSSGARVALGDGAAGFRTSTSLGPGREAFAMDLDRDGLSDVALVEDGRTTLRFGDAAGTLQRTVTLPIRLGGAGSTGLALADLDGDGIRDVARIEGNFITPSRLHVYFGAGGGAFDADVALDLATGDTGLRAVRLDGERRKALLVFDRSGRMSFFRIGSDRGLEKVSPDVSTGTVLDGAEFSDVNEDGRRDIVFLYQYQDALGARTSTATLLARRRSDR